MGEPSEKDGSFSVPAEQPTRHFTDAEVRRNYEYILTSTNLYPPELHSAVRSVLSEPPLNPDWSDKGRQIAALFTPYGDREYQGDLLYRTRLHGEDGISFFFDEGYTYIPWNGLAFLLDAMIEDGDYPNPVVEEQPDPIGDYNIPDEVDEMGGPHRQMTIGEADFDYVLDAVAYEAGETVVEPVKPQAIVQMENDTPAAGDEPASVPDENPPVVVEAPETALPTDTAEQPTPPPVKGNTTAHKNFRRFQELFPEIVSGQYEYLRLEAGEAYCAYAASCGVIPLAPHTIFTQYLNDAVPEQREQGLRMGHELLERCDELWVMGDTISQGMKDEIGLATFLQLPILYVSDDMVKNQKMIRQSDRPLDINDCIPESSQYNYENQFLVLKPGVSSKGKDMTADDSIW